MLFFIFALAGILLQMSVMQKQGACDTQAFNSVNTLTSKLSQVLFSPSEDEKQTYSLPPAIETGGGNVLYQLNITYSEKTTEGVSNGRLFFYINPLSEIDCSSGTNIALGDTSKFILAFVNQYGEVNKAVPDEPFVLTPSGSIDGLKRSRYIIILKCSEKSPNGINYIFIQDCHKESITECTELNFNSGMIKACCGWSDKAGCTIT
jgi:hypothetical protein